MPGPCGFVLAGRSNHIPPHTNTHTRTHTHTHTHTLTHTHTNTHTHTQKHKSDKAEMKSQPKQNSKKHTNKPKPDLYTHKNHKPHTPNPKTRDPPNLPQDLSCSQSSVSSRNRHHQEQHLLGFRVYGSRGLGDWGLRRSFQGPSRDWGFGFTRLSLGATLKEV